LAKYSENPEVISIMSTLNLLAFLLGGLAGLCMEEISIYLINKRVTEPITLKFSGSIGKSLSWIAAGAFSWFFVVYINGLNLKTVEILLLLSVCIVLSVVDITIRKIPNALVLLALVTGYVFPVLYGDNTDIKFKLFGLFIGLAVFMLPMFFGKLVGMGDVKFAAAVGFCLGVYGFLISMILMSVVLVAYTIYLYATGKGTVKSKIALGPFLAFGFVSVILLKMLNENYTFLDFIMNRLYLG
jgi:Flp pilus assembly protein protease CpaA